jgi:hypothetical protein
MNVARAGRGRGDEGDAGHRGAFRADRRPRTLPAFRRDPWFEGELCPTFRTALTASASTTCCWAPRSGTTRSSGPTASEGTSGRTWRRLSPGDDRTQHGMNAEEDGRVVGRVGRRMGDRRDSGGAAVEIVERKIAEWGDVDRDDFRIVRNLPADGRIGRDARPDRRRTEGGGNGGSPPTDGNGTAEEMKALDHIFARARA